MDTVRIIRDSLDGMTDEDAVRVAEDLGQHFKSIDNDAASETIRADVARFRAENDPTQPALFGPEQPTLF